MRALYSIFFALTAFSVLLSACGKPKDDIIPPRPPQIEGNSLAIDETAIEHHTVVSAGDSEVHSYRIPAVVCTPSGTLLVFSEARRNSWMDLGYIDVAVQRSTDGGKTWSEPRFITSSSGDAFANPSPVVDMKTGKVFVFCCRWSSSYSGDDRKKYNKVYLISSSDDGLNWSTPEDVNSSITPDGWYTWGFGPGSGIQLANGANAGRMIVPAQQWLMDDSKKGNRSIYSDDGGKTWQLGKTSQTTSEVQFADLGDNLVYSNRRAAGSRYVGYSRDGGVEWGGESKDSSLPAASKGCHASVLGLGNGMLFYCGIGGGSASAGRDERSRLQLWRSQMKGYSWEDSQLIWEEAAGYPDMCILKDGRLAVVFEAANGQGFITSGSRPAGWMRLDIIVFPKEITDSNYWFAK